MAGRRPEAEYKIVLEETRALVERLCREHGCTIPASVVRQYTGWGASTAQDRLARAAERGLLRLHPGSTYSPAVDAEGRPVRLALVPDEPKSEADPGG